jgi:hypothetical protein
MGAQQKVSSPILIGEGIKTRKKKARDCKGAVTGKRGVLINAV